jgi:MoxR-like ATPase
MEQNHSPEFIDKIKKSSSKFELLKQEIGKVIVGHTNIVSFSLVAMLSNGHVLLEGVPGVAKTTLIKSISDALGLAFSRIQFTPDLLPSDIVGTLIYNPKSHEFETKKGPIFANLVLADEINRSPAKVQSALLEAMQERQVTIGSETHKLDEPFLVFATQNPIENEGTYSLPEAQVDRFMFKLLVGYPTIEQEKEILYRSLKKVSVQKVLTKKDIIEAQNLIKDIFIDPRVVQYILDLVFATRDPEKYKLGKYKSMIQYGVSPRATIALAAAAKSYAFVQGRHFVIPDDVKAIAPAILSHRILLSYEAEAEGVTSRSLVEKILDTLIVP